MSGTLTSILVIAVIGTALFCAYRAAATARTSQGAMGWVIFLLSAPYLAIPAYLFLGQHRYSGYLNSRRSTQRVIEGIKAFAAQNAPAAGSTQIDLASFEAIADLPAVRGNSAKLLIDGPAAFDEIFATIDAAERYVLVQFYIVRDDNLGRFLKERLIAAVERGVTVRFMTDRVGSVQLPDSYTQDLRDAGVEVVDKRSARGPKFRFQINFRNHRKTVVVDGRVGFIGGLNVGDEYMGYDPHYGHWRDTHLRLTGPMVSQLQLIFSEDWHWVTSEVLLDNLNWVAPHADQDMTGLIVATGPGDRTESGSLMFFSAITAARTRIWIASPYFVPDIDILTALKHAALRGVDVRLMVPDVIDHYLPWLAAFSYFDELMELGITVFRYNSGFMHQKVFVIDDDLAAVGTANLDNRSFRLNFEAMALVFDARAAKEVAEMLEKDFARSYRLDKTLAQQPARIRYGALVARLFSPIL